MSVEILPIGYYTVTVTTPETYTIEVVTPEAYTVTVTEPESYSIGINGTQGPPGPQGPAGPNEITTSTETNITGLLKGNGTNVEQAVDGTDYNSQDLQQVTDKGAITNNVVQLSSGFDIYDQTNDNWIQVRGGDGYISAKVDNATQPYFYAEVGNLAIGDGVNKAGVISSSILPASTQKFFNLPAIGGSSATLVTSVNGVVADSTGDVTIAAGVTSVSAVSPITSSGGSTPSISTSMATNKLIGRSTAGTGVMEEISIGTGLSLSAGTLSSTSVGLASGTTSGTDTYTTTIPNVTGYVTNDTYVVKFTNANTGASTININGLGAKTLVKNVASALVGGDIQAGQEMIIIYDGTNFQVIGIAPNQMFAFVTNDDSVTITKGQVVYAFGAAGDRMSVKLASNLGDPTSAKTIGLVYSSSIAPNGTGFIITQGVIQNLNLGAYTAGDTLYLGSTPGTYTNVKPYAPNHLVYVGIVERANPGNGQIYVRCQNGYELDEIHNVDLVSVAPANNDVLVYETGVNNLWKNKSIPTILGYTPPRTYNQNTTPTGTGTSSIPTGSLWFHSDTGIQYTYYYDGNTYQWTQETLPLGPQGPQGANGTNNIDGLTTTTLNGLLKGNGSVVSATSVLTEIGFTPENVANKENVTLDTSSTKYPTNNLVKTSLDAFADDVDYAIMINQRILFNF